jgi:hypothetical protein
MSYAEDHGPRTGQSVYGTRCSRGTFLHGLGLLLLGQHAEPLNLQQCGIIM